MSCSHTHCHSSEQSQWLVGVPAPMLFTDGEHTNGIKTGRAHVITILHAHI